MNYGISGRYKVMVIDAKTKRIKRQDREWHNNLIMNTGMNQIASSLICDLFTYARAGSGTTTGNELSSSYGTTANCDVAGNVTLVGGTFTFDGVAPSDHNNIIKWDTGEEGRIDTIPASATATTCTVLPLPSAPLSGNFVMYRTNMTDLATHIVGTANYLPISPYCGTSVIGNLIIHQRTWDFPAETGTVNYTEMGVGWSASTTNQLFSRFLLSSVTSVNSGEQLRLVYQLRMVMEPYDDTTKTATVTGWATVLTGKERVQLLGMSSVSSVGATTNYDGGVYGNEPSRITNVNAWLSTDSTANAAFGSCVNRHAGMPTLGYGAVSSTAYAAYSYTAIKQLTFGIGQGNSTSIRSMGLGWNTGSNNPAQVNTVCYVFDYPQTKTSLYTLDMQWFHTWSRVLSAASV